MSENYIPKFYDADTVVDSSIRDTGTLVIFGNPVSSLVMVGIPTVPTAEVGTNTEQIASTAFVNASISLYQPLDADLTALSQLTGVGYAHRLEDGTWSLESVSSSVSWGSIGGTLANQTDLVEALNLKANTDDLGDSATKDVGTTSGTVAAGDDSRIVAGGTALQPTGNGASLTGMTASQVGLGNVDNTSDANKPVSTAQATAITAQVFAEVALTNPYSATPALTPRRVGDRAYNTTSLEWWDGIATAGATTSWQLAASGGGGSGDMTKAVYDTVNRGYVDRAVLADTATTAGTISGSTTLSHISDAGTAAAQNIGYFATAAQGAKADTALQANQTITLSSDATGSGTTAISVTLSNSGVSAGSYGSATAVPAITVDAKGRVTAVTATSIQIAESQVTNLPADLAAKAALTGATFTGDVAVTESSSMGNLLTITNTDATNYSRIKYVGTGNTFSAGVGNASATIAELRNNFYVYDFTGAKSILIGTPSGVWNLTQYTASRALALDDSKNIVSSATTAVELGYVHGVTSPIQEQLAGKAASADLTAEVTRAAAAEALKAPLATPIITEATATRTLALTDANSIIRCTYASAVAITIPPSASVAFVVGTTILVRQAGAGQIALAAGSGVTLNSSTTLKTKGQHATVALTKIASDEWDVTGERALS